MALARLRLDAVVWVRPDEINRPKADNHITVFEDLMVKRGLFTAPGTDGVVWDALAMVLLLQYCYPQASQKVATTMSADYT